MSFTVKYEMIVIFKGKVLQKDGAVCHSTLLLPHSRHHAPLTHPVCPRGEAGVRQG